ncbi:mandelate racemase/muconate lactonizing enzyme family protein [Brevibacillus dissolubilis]|uniref:mandelate racemase/muconate lactonizing enzyme family protein n=1 Tax=Brevibacillus dissolubilis TaxID=1844116 RepID=UPI00111667E4|nr:mandelate racemase/muconate lactonizing enzyme family protein [Brevibacillus dissolubilis]
MIIERIETFPLLHECSRPYGDANGYKKYRSCYLIRITTKSGYQGYGECIDWLPTLEKGFQERIIPYLIGKRATDRTNLTKIIKKWHMRSAAAVSMALTEIIAQKAGLHITDLWGGKIHDTVPAYASFQSYSDDPNWQEYSIGLVKKAIQEGFSMAKVKIGGRTIKEDQAHIKRMQQELQGDVQLALDANQSYDVMAARSWERLFQGWDNLLWLEEPMPMEKVEEYKLLRQVLSVPLAGGENMKNATAFLPLVTQGAVDILQPDTMHQDGIDGYRCTLQLARTSGLRVSPHAFDGGLSRIYALYAQACLPAMSKMDGDKIEPVEWDYMENPFTMLFQLKPQKGMYTIPSGTGLGLSVDEDVLNTYRWDGRTYI